MNFNVDNVRVVKIMGGSLEQSKVVKGMVFAREPEGIIKKAQKAKVALQLQNVLGTCMKAAVSPLFTGFRRTCAV